jgi:hypothetical protein
MEIRRFPRSYLIERRHKESFFRASAFFPRRVRAEIDAYLTWKKHGSCPVILLGAALCRAPLLSNPSSLTTTLSTAATPRYTDFLLRIVSSQHSSAHRAAICT